MIYLLVCFYILLAGLFFREWLFFFLNDKEMSSRSRWISSIILVIATICWPLIVPLAYLELLKFHKRNKVIIDLLLSLPNTTVIENNGYFKEKIVESLKLSFSNYSQIKKE
ncbi:hypothetical protein CK510_10790 [Brunnivagina elsteri CCALA 953]|uniref:Uncharacterized protein n=1 Tax=Brunnivagina elsteri CCALA 953 TaxID=987040 RepID=A0A2A2TK72_9CYAN|nr:hypothetical protein CK510_10790 [Calothrix elsteri CCALA 953]